MTNDVWLNGAIDNIIELIRINGGIDIDGKLSAMRYMKSAVKTLIEKGYRWEDGELWKPPLGKQPDFDRLDKIDDFLSKHESWLNTISATVHEHTDFIKNSVKDSVKDVNAIEKRLENIEEALRKHENRLDTIDKTIGLANYENKKSLDKRIGTLEWLHGP